MVEEEPPPKKKQKAGGSFCAVGGCSNRCNRDKVSAHTGRKYPDAEGHYVGFIESLDRAQT